MDYDEIENGINDDEETVEDDTDIDEFETDGLNSNELY